MKNNKSNIKTTFKVLGYYEEYFVDNKFVGTKPSEFDGERTLGWFGRQTSYATEDLILERGKKIKTGVVGYGFSAKIFQCPFIVAHKDFESFVLSAFKIINSFTVV